MEFILNNAHWFWLAIMVICIIVEACTLALTTVWPALAALPMIFISRTHMPLHWQILIFLVLTILLIFFTRPFAIKKFKLGKYKTNADSILGDEVICVKDVTAFEKGEVKSKNGVIWTAKTENGTEIKSGAVCVVTEIQGNTLIIKEKI